MAGGRQRYLALRTGVSAAAAVTGLTFARGLLPRSASDQAMLTGAVAAYGLGVGTLAVSTIEASAELVSQARHGGDPTTTTLATGAALAAGGYAAARILPTSHDTGLAVATLASGARILTTGALAATLVIGSDEVLRPFTGSKGALASIGTAAAIGGAASVIRVRRMDRRAAEYGEDLSDRRIGSPASARGALAMVGLGSAVGAGLLALAGTEFAVAEGSTTLASRVLGRADDPVTPLVGHSIAAAGLLACGAMALRRLSRRVQHADDVVEPAYPEPPTSRFVTAGPVSEVSFDDIGKEGRRFVLMALTAEEIGRLMGEPALDPIRAVAGFESADTPEERAALALRELDALGAYDRSVIVVAAPTGVGYVNYSFAEALEYLTRGDCAIVVPQYALVPSALALGSTRAGVRLQTLVLEGIRDRIAALPEGHRPRLLQYGESLGAQVALDVADSGTRRFDELGVERGLYLGTPFRTRLWGAWFADEQAIDPTQSLGAVASADEIPLLAPTVRHVQVIHHDDPINKFAYDAVVRAPWWMGPPRTRPPLVPRETEFRPIITFVINLVDLKNGMDSKPGHFVRRGHDYRIELCDAIRHTYGLPASDEQVAEIEKALRAREQEWAARRMVAKRFASARASVIGQLSRWGVDPATIGLDEETAAKLAKGDLSGLIARLGSSGPVA